MAKNTKVWERVVSVFPQITPAGKNVWEVFGREKYMVYKEGYQYVCNCPSYANRGYCKHVFAVKILNEGINFLSVLEEELFIEPRYPKPVILLLSGKIRAGKTSIAKDLVKKLTLMDIDAVKLSFADGVKRVAREDYGWDGEKDEEGRQLLQEIGAEGRGRDRDYWVKQLLANIEPGTEVIIVDDFRYPNEFYMLADIYPTYTARIIRNPEDVTHLDHVSETALQDFRAWNLEVFNHTIPQASDAILSFLLPKLRRFL